MTKQCITRLSIIMLAMLLLIPSAMAQDEETPPSSGGMNIKITLPPSFTNPAVAGVVREFVTSYTSEFMSNSLDWIQDLPVTNGAPYELWITGEDFPVNDDIVSVRLNVYEYTGGAHGNHSFKTYVVDTAEERVLTLEDIFIDDSDPIATLQPLVRTYLKENLESFDDMDSWIDTGTEADPANYSNYVITADEFIVYFPPYQVAPYAWGSPEVHIPLSELASILKLPFNELVNQG